MAYKKLPDLTIPDTKKNSERELRKNNERSVCFCNNYHIYASIFYKKKLVFRSILAATWPCKNYKKVDLRCCFFGTERKKINILNGNIMELLH